MDVITLVAESTTFDAKLGKSFGRPASLGNDSSTTTEESIVTTQELAFDTRPDTGMGTVAELITYPIKGCAGTSTLTAVITPAGLTHDRAFMVVGADGTFRSQRRDPRLSVIRPELDAAGARMTLHAPGIAPAQIEIDPDGPRLDITMFNDPYVGIDQGDAVAGWLGEVMQSPSRLVRVPPDHDRVTTGVNNGTCGFADSGAMLLVSRATLDELNSRLVGRGSAPLPMNRFRPNIVIAGDRGPHTEDLGRRITIGEAELGYQKLCIRCAVTLVEQETGRKAGPEPLRTLATYRRATAGGVAFGSKYSVLRPGRLAVGDDLTVVEWGGSEV